MQPRCLSWQGFCFPHHFKVQWLQWQSLLQGIWPCAFSLILGMWLCLSYIGWKKIVVVRQSVWLSLIFCAFCILCMCTGADWMCHFSIHKCIEDWLSVRCDWKETNVSLITWQNTEKANRPWLGCTWKHDNFINVIAATRLREWYKGLWLFMKTKISIITHADEIILTPWSAVQYIQISYHEWHCTASYERLCF